MEQRAVSKGIASVCVGLVLVSATAGCKGSGATTSFSTGTAAPSAVAQPPSPPSPHAIAPAEPATAPSSGGACPTSFLDEPRTWRDVSVRGGGMDAIRTQIDASDRHVATRITVEAGTYKGRCLYIEDHLRTADAPLWLRANGVVQIDCTDGNGQAIGVAHSSYIALDGFTVGPERGGYGDSAVHISGIPKKPESRAPADYGGHEPAHHIVVRGLTARNLYRPTDGDENPNAFESGCCDAVKTNQAEYVWVTRSKVSRTARHGFDNVGVHHAYFCDNELVDMMGAGFGMEAKGGSSDVLFAHNRLERVRHRGIVLGGEGTDNVFRWPWDATYEGKDIVARNNVIVDAAEGGLGFYGCDSCSALGNTVWFRPGFRTWVDGKMSAEPHDAMRMYDSTIEGARDELRSGWTPRRVGEKLRSQRNRVEGNLFGAAAGDMTCALDAEEHALAGLSMSHNVLWNGGKPLPDCSVDVRARFPDSASHYGDLDPRVGADLRATAPSARDVGAR